MSGAEMVFVYGTLRKGASNHWRLDGARFVAGGSVAGELYRIAWYPGLLLNGGGRVKGEVYEVSEEKLRRLDAFEGCAPENPEPHEYRRVKVPVRLDDGSDREAWAWEFILPVGDRTPVATGDWLNRR